MKTLFTPFALVLLALPFAVACASSSDDSDSAGASADLSTAAQLSGTFEANGTNDIGENAITFNADHTYLATGGCGASPGAAHCFALTQETGTWKLAKSGPQLGAPGGASEVVLTNGLDQTTKTFFFSLSNGGKDLELATIFNGQSASFTKSDSASPLASAKASLVGKWSDATDEGVSFHAIDLQADSTYTAQGGCRPQQGCFAITEQNGTWKVGISGPQLGAPQGAQQIVLTDSLGQTTTLFFNVDSSGKALEMSARLVGDEAHFTRQ